MRFSTRRIAFFVSVFFMLEKQKQENKEKQLNGKRPPSPIKMVFLRWSSKNVKKQKNGFFSKNWLTLFVSGTGDRNAHFRAHYLFWPKCFLGPKQCKPGNTIKIVVSAEIAQNQK